MVIRAIKGTRDIFGSEAKKWNIVERKIFEFAKKYNYEEMKIPTFESTQLYLRGIGDETDIVNKEMYTFTDKGGRSITLRPEGTAGIVRAYIENKMYADKTVKKLFYMGSMFRQERPQKGRYREFRQFGIENIGTEEALADAEVIDFAYDLYKALGLKSVKIEINSIGCKECRKKYIKALKDYLRPHYEELCDDCQRRFETNTLRILDCKNPKCKMVTEKAPSTIDYLCDDCKKHFETVLHYLDVRNIPYVVNNRLVRGLDYYTRTVFEVTTDRLGSQNAIAAGGRYDYLIGMFHSEEIPAVGIAGGMDRLILLMDEEGLFDDIEKNKPDIFIAAVNNDVRDDVVRIAGLLRVQGFSVETDLAMKSLKSQLRRAGKLNVKNVIIAGPDEIAKDLVIYKNMERHSQKEIKIEELNDFKKILE